MANMKVTLGRLPDFKLPVTFNMPNGEKADIVFTVRHMKASEMQDLYNTERSDSQMITDIASGWNLPEEFNQENAQELVDLYPGAALALAGAYLSALAGQRVKN